MRKRKTHREVMEELLKLFGETYEQYEEREARKEKERINSGDYYKHELYGPGLPHVI